MIDKPILNCYWDSFATNIRRKINFRYYIAHTGDCQVFFQNNLEGLFEYWEIGLGWCDTCELIGLVNLWGLLERNIIASDLNSIAFHVRSLSPLGVLVYGLGVAIHVSRHWPLVPSKAGGRCPPYEFSGGQTILDLRTGRKRRERSSERRRCL